MKKTITFLLLLVAIATTQAQSFTVPNGDFSSGALPLTGAGPIWYSDNVFPANPATNTTSFTITQTSPVVLTPDSSGITADGKLRIIGTANGTQGQLLITTPRIDISGTAPGNNYFVFTCTVVNPTDSTGKMNTAIRLWDASGAAIALTTTTLTKLNPQFIAGQPVVYGGVLAINVGGTTPNPKYMTLDIQAGKFVISDLTFDDFALYATSAAPTTVVSAPTGADLSYETGTGPSAESSFTVSGENLGTDPVTITTGANLEISSTTGAEWSTATSIILTPTAGAVANTTIYARVINILSPGAPGAASIRATILHATAGSKTVQFTANLTGIGMSTPASTALGYVQGAGPSAEQSFNVSGAGLTADVEVTPGANIEISNTSGTGYVSTPITLTQTAGVLSSTPIYARLKAGLSVTTYNDATTKVVASSTGYTSKEVQFEGTVDASTFIKNISNSDIKIIAANGTIQVFGLVAGKQIEIFNYLGQKVKSVTATDNNSISLSAKGIYFIKVDAFVQKVILK